MSTATAPSGVELQSLLLAVATAEGVSKIKAFRERNTTWNSLVKGGIGEAAVEILGRLTNQLLSV